MHLSPINHCNHILAFAMAHYDDQGNKHCITLHDASQRPQHITSHNTSYLYYRYPVNMFCCVCILQIVLLKCGRLYWQIN